VNRSQSETVTTEIAWRGAAPTRASGITQIAGTDLKAVNSFEQPNTIVPQQLDDLTVDNGKLTLSLPPLSFTVVPVSGFEQK
jgi:alpha-N-arabinofuranosidase